MGVALERDNDPNFFDTARSLGISYPVGLPDSQDSVANYPTQGIPYVVLIDKQGRIRYTHDGYSPDEKAEFEKEINTLLNEK
jgi:cytochrome oxidase Cu insertion factor (SCO1/SenC/PrrC family)